MIRRLRTKITLAVPLLLMAIAWYFGPPALTWPWWLGGVVGVIGGTAMRLWASGYLLKDERVIREGPFHFTRNPLYLGTTLIGLGFAALTGRWESVILVALTVALVYQPTIYWEEQFLTDRFGEDYLAYMHTVPRWVPRMRGSFEPALSFARYRWTLVKHHQEHVHLSLHLAMLLAFIIIDCVK